ncbi:TolC family protein [Desulfosediminicola flagellatus]|uniref:TolC family protein n=1 Tax=Desulfosediminicola flagellatus TaxID=2569541 RepID=UPI0010AD2ABB|nr:TolC family protein [Desulfosediminicola flagellatus]
MPYPTIRISHIIVFFVLFTVNNSMATTTSLTLNDVIELTLKNNPQIEIARHQYSQNDAVLTQSRSLYYPQVGTGADYSRIRIDNLQPTDEDNVASIQLEVSQRIYDFGKTTGLIDASSFNLEAASANLTQIYHDIVLEVKSSFYSVLEKQRLIIVARQAVDNYEQQLYRAKRYFDAGVRTRIDVTNAEVNLSNQKLGLLRAKSDLQTARVKLQQVMGIVPNNGEYEIISEEFSIDDLAEGKPEMPEDIDTLLVTAQQLRPGLNRFSQLVKAAEASVTQAKGDYWPTIAASGVYTYYESDLSTFNDQWQLGVGLQWQLFSGFATDGKVAEAKARLREVNASLREFELAVVQDVNDSYLRADVNRAGVDIADQSLGLARENLELADKRYQSGLGDLLEFNDAQLLYTRNQSDLVTTYYAYLISLARIERATGNIPDLKEYDLK